MKKHSFNISVVLCTYNGVQYLGEQLDSILSQSLLPNEIVISDDNSTDGTLEFVKEHLEKAIKNNSRLSNISLIFISNNPGLGISHNFLGALKQASGDLVALSDQDDVWVHNKLKLMEEIFEANPSLTLLHTDALLVDRNNNDLGLSLFDALRVSPLELKRIQQGRAVEVLARRNLVTGATTMLRRSLVDNIENIPQGWLHDEFLGLIASGMGSVDVLPQALIKYRQHGANQVGASRPGLRQLVGRVLHPGLQRNKTLLSRAESLASHPAVTILSKESELSQLSDAKLAHELTRSEFAVNRIARLPQVFKEVRTGRYNSVGLGFPDVIRDLLQPLTDN